MIGIQIITHGKLAEGLIDSIDMIIGETENIVYNELERGQDFEVFREEVLRTTKDLLSQNSGGVLIFVDIFGASPYNASLLNSREINSMDYKVISGVNLPTLIESIFSRKNMDLDELYKYLFTLTGDSFVGWEKE